MSDRRRRADGHRDDKEDAEDPQEKAERLKSVSAARLALAQDPRAGGKFAFELEAPMVAVSRSSPKDQAPHQFSHSGGARRIGASHLVTSKPFGPSSR